MVKATPWIVPANQAWEWVQQGATVLDARPYLLWLLGHIPGAVWVDWKVFTDSGRWNRGKLLTDSTQLQAKLQQLGVFQSRPVVVVGHPQHRCYFGEDGRIVWMLRTLGHETTAWVDGGHKALTDIGVPIVWGITAVERGDFTLQRTLTWSIEAEALRERLNSSTQIIDSREAREYEGRTPYGEARGGHFPGAIHFYFKSCLDGQGKLKSSPELLSELQEVGIQPQYPTVVYCTGGVRSAFLVGVLQQLGWNEVKNYPGSTWEWSVAGYPLRT